jgi:hypothetical protein
MSVPLEVADDALVFKKLLLSVCFSCGLVALILLYIVSSIACLTFFRCFSKQKKNNEHCEFSLNIFKLRFFLSEVFIYLFIYLLYFFFLQQSALYDILNYSVYRRNNYQIGGKFLLDDDFFFCLLQRPIAHDAIFEIRDQKLDEITSSFLDPSCWLVFTLDLEVLNA